MKSKFTKLLGILLSLVLLLGLTGCGSKSATQDANTANSGTVGASGTGTGQGGLVIATSFYPIYIMTLNVVGNTPGVQVTTMAPTQSGCLHDYQFTPRDLTTLEKAQIFVINGAGMENFMDKVLQQRPQLKVVEASKGMTFLKNTSDGEPNPHVWVSISGAIQEVKNIGDQLAKADPEHAQQYRANAAAYIKKLETLKQQMHQALDGVTNRNIITFHEAFPYFAKEFNLNIVAVMEREPGSQPSAGELADTIKLVKASKVKALFAEPQYSTKAADTIARETGARVYLLDPAVTGPTTPDAYLNTMNNNLKVLKEALK